MSCDHYIPLSHTAVVLHRADNLGASGVLSIAGRSQTSCQSLLAVEGAGLKAEIRSRLVCTSLVCSKLALPATETGALLQYTPSAVHLCPGVTRQRGCSKDFTLVRVA